jgi:hypothetical protein
MLSLQRLALQMIFGRRTGAACPNFLKTQFSETQGMKRAGAVRHRPFPLSSPYYSSSALLGITLLGSSILGTLAQEVIIAATLSVLR